MAKKRPSRPSTKAPAGTHRGGDRALVAAAKTSVSYQGPLPPPEQFLLYNDGVPDGCERLMRMAESEQAHRQKLEREMVAHNKILSMGGLVCGFIIGVTAIGGATACIILGQGWPGTVFGGVGLFALVRVFITGTRLRQADASG